MKGAYVLMEKITVAYIGGGSKDWAHKYFSDILSQNELSGKLRLYDIDKPAAYRNKKYFDKLVSCNSKKVKSEWVCETHDTIETALEGADFVVISILPYTFNEMKIDVHYPEKYGIWQSVGDTVGPGGYSRALRTIPSYIFFAQKIRQCCPDAWVINYTNPMSICVNVLYREFPEIKAFGCCHAVFGLQTLLSSIMSMYLLLCENGREAFMKGDLSTVINELKSCGVKKFSPTAVQKLNRQDIATNVQGINHFSWVNEAKYGDTDILPIYSAFIGMYREYNLNRLKSYVPDIIKKNRNKEHVMFSLFEKYGVCAASGGRHLAEFIPDPFLTKKNVLPYGFKLTTVSSRIFHDKLLILLTKLYTVPGVRVKIKKSGEEGVEQIIALCGLGDMCTNVNMPNTGQAPNLVMDTAVETNALINSNGAAPLNSGDMTPETAALVNVHAQNQKDFVEAYFKKDKKALLQVFCNDPAVSRIGKEKGEKLFSEMLEANRHTLEDWLLNV